MGRICVQMRKEKAMPEPLIPPHGGYRRLVTYQLGVLIYDATAAFCARYISPKNRTFDQMVQAARSGVANIIEGSEASATSKKTELKLTNVAKASQEELLFDYQSFLRQKGLSEWAADSPESVKVRCARCSSLDKLRRLMAALVSDLPARSDREAIKAEVAANVMICLINQETYLLARQIARLGADFETGGGFTERLYRVRSERRKMSDESDRSDKSDKR